VAPIAWTQTQTGTTSIHEDGALEVHVEEKLTVRLRLKPEGQHSWLDSDVSLEIRYGLLATASLYLLLVLMALLGLGSALGHLRHRRKMFL
jgi:hypothetical protein